VCKLASSRGFASCIGALLTGGNAPHGKKGRLLKLKDPQPMPPPMAKAKGVRRCMSARCHLRKHYRTRVAR
jgi:hypothetical protein